MYTHSPIHYDFTVIVASLPAWITIINSRNVLELSLKVGYIGRRTGRTGRTGRGSRGVCGGAIT